MKIHMYDKTDDGSRIDFVIIKNENEISDFLKCKRVWGNRIKREQKRIIRNRIDNFLLAFSPKKMGQKKCAGTNTNI